MVPGLSSAVLAYHAVKTAGVVINLVAFPTLRPGGVPSTRTSVLVPARDEADRLHRTLPGLLAQPAEEILVLDDGSRDGTAAIVTSFADREPRLRLLTGTPPPAGWTGKSWACHQLAAAATGDLLVFCDADVTLRPGALAAVEQQITAQRADVFSVFPRQETRTLGERLLVPLVDETLLGFLPHPLLAAPVPAAAAANGQLLAFRRTAYHRLGGHAAVAGALVEDLALARRTRAQGLRLGLALGGELVTARMYPGYPAAVAGFGKSLRAAHGGSAALLMAGAAARLAVYCLPWLYWRHRAWRWAILLGLAERLLVNAKCGRRAYLEAALVPVGAAAALPVYLVALRRTARWKGRDYS
ncbi:MAG TPA: glycosyltransferase family 2 protein [Actinophytocola sp.]|uniref:glycosyltransferase family 2 protein n=1 Tax=Actinophytocola sp. TaxID=1872138 RepID=UPI002DB90375|nr:glycosyltransferase family 2 protein [Actinophytocola sp.]HEU5473315.1 glycosyltransferase family 2 protein [Actinophytocola sp.]